MRTTLLCLGALLVAGAGCVPMRVSSARQQQIDECLKQCPRAAGERQTPQLRENQWVDSRTTCERRCHDIAAGDWTPTGKPPPEQSADAGPEIPLP